LLKLTVTSRVELSEHDAELGRHNEPKKFSIGKQNQTHRVNEKRMTPERGEKMKALPENLATLHAGEEQLWAQVVTLIENDTDLSAHIDLAERAMNLIQFFVREHVAVDADHQATQLLGIRLFNGFGSALRLMMAGYYQPAAMIQRDLLETVFLIAYLHLYPEKILTWRTADGKTRLKEFAPVRIRIALDEHQGVIKKKREAAYKLFCELAAHPTYKGFHMLAPEGLGARVGPFLDEPKLKALIEEHARLAIQAAEAFTVFFPTVTLADIENKLSFMEVSSEWVQRYYNIPRAPLELAELRRLLAEVRACQPR
jgi:hypothetical protein